MAVREKAYKWKWDESKNDYVKETYYIENTAEDSMWPERIFNAVVTALAVAWMCFGAYLVYGLHILG